MTLYFNDAAVDGDWDTLGNWWEELDGVDGGTADVAASALPTSSDDVVLLAPCYTNSGSTPTVVNLEVRPAYIGITITVTGLASFVGNYSSNNGTITGNCTFTGAGAYNAGMINGDADFTYPAALSLYGTVSGTATRTGYTDLYFKNVTADGAWNNGNNWFIDEECLYNAWINDGPWMYDDITKDLNLHRGSDSISAEDYVYIASDIGNGFVITGDCDIAYIGLSGSFGYITNNGNIYGGTFSGDGFNNNSGFIYGGTFSGDYSYNNYEIYGGIFSGDYFNNNSYIYGGIFSGDGFYTSYSIYGGTFSGDYLNNSYYIYGGTFSGYGFNNNYDIYGGTFSGDGFNNSYYIYGGTFSGDSFNNSYYIYGGIFSGDYFNNNSYIYGGIFSGDGFYTSYSIYGFWLESGSLDVAQYTYDGYSYVVSGYLRITGKYSNPQPYSSGYGFMTLSIGGQDVLGTGLL